MALLLDFLALFRDTEGHRYQLWQLNVLRLLKEMLSHATAASELASSRPMLARFIGLLSKSADNFMSREERIVSTGVLQGVWNMTAQLRLHATLIDVTLVDVLVRYAAGAAVGGGEAPPPAAGRGRGRGGNKPAGNGDGSRRRWFRRLSWISPAFREDTRQGCKVRAVTGSRDSTTGSQTIRRRSHRQ